ncbi:hypothetical protein D3D02_05430 [Halobellus sp. Atlit-38R]|jgi:hypothetical protein|uniref:DUF7289 family protein n=1 Tax=Halobellus sp. Atlit-38R TaxID=2282131 RepID=UPI000EF1DBCC|nr:hypothetical protein [Halobellus sp. Atlit-38R]RLM90210.1 hypothetical protein D3D02_05430 [Halobellus sp. Atlit-38R]
MTNRAQASNIGLVLLLALTITGGGVVVALGGSALTDVQDQTSIDRAEHAMTLLDARAAVVGLGEGSVQTVRLGASSGGEYAAESESGWLRIRHVNYTAGETETVYNASLGSVTYRKGETTVAYQGGGVWRQGGSGGTTMVSPPEFHYRGTTLTLPVLRVRSTDAASGDARATIRRESDLTRIFPDETGTATDGPGAPYDEPVDGDTHSYVNPVRNGTVDVTVHSAYYEGWADYFQTRTTGNVSVDHDNQTATVVLETTNQVGQFPYPEKGESIPVRGIAEGHSVTDFQTSVKQDSGSFNNLFVSFYIEDGDKSYEVAVEVTSGTGQYCKSGGSATLAMDVYYYDESTAEGVHRWTNDSIPAESGDVRLDCDEDDDTIIEIDFTGTEQNLTYGSDSIDGTAIDWDDHTFESGSVTFGHTDDDEPTTYDDGDAETLRTLTRHYFATFDSEFDLTAGHGSGNRGSSQISLSESGGTLRYDTIGGESYIKYLHVTENNVTVELN